MKETLLKILIIASFLFSNCVFSGTAESRYELPHHGALILNTPNEWIAHVRYPPGDIPPTIRFTQKTGEQFEILFTPMWKMPGAQANFGTRQSIKHLVEGAAIHISSRAAETHIKVKELPGSNIGYYFSVTEKAPKPDEYKYMSQGAIGINEILVTFTILTNSSNSAVIHQAIKMFGSMRHLQ